MTVYNAPGVYVQDIVSGSQSIEQASSSIGIMIGVTRSGKIGVAQKIGSWTEFIAKTKNISPSNSVSESNGAYQQYLFPDLFKTIFPAPENPSFNDLVARSKGILSSLVAPSSNL